MQIHPYKNLNKTVFNGNCDKTPSNSNYTDKGDLFVQIPLLGFKSLFTNSKTTRFNYLSKAHPKEFKILSLANIENDIGGKFSRFNMEDITEILEKIEAIPKNDNTREPENFLKTLIYAKEYDHNWNIKEQFNKDEICSLIDVYSTENPKLVEKLIVAENTDEFAEHLHQFDAEDIPHAIRTIKKNPNLESKIIEAEKVPNRNVLISLAKDIDGEYLNGDQIDIALTLIRTKNKNNYFILEDDQKFQGITLRELKQLDKKDLPLIISMCKCRDIDFNLAANLAHGINEHHPDKTDTAVKLLSGNIIMKNYAQLDSFLQKPDDLQEKLLSVISEKAEFFKNNEVNIEAVDEDLSQKINFVETDPLFNNLAENTKNLIFSEHKIPFNAVKHGADLTKKLPKDLAEKSNILTNNVFILGIYNAQNFISDSFTDNYVKTICKLDKFEAQTGEKLKSILIDNFDSVYDGRNIGDAESNIDYFKDKNITSYSDEHVKNILFSKGTNLTKNKETLDYIMSAHKDEIISQIEQKCENLPPDYGEDIVSLFNNSEETEQLILLPEISEKTIVDSCFGAAKIVSYVREKPQDYINGFYNEKIIDIVKSDLQHIPLSQQLTITPEEGVLVDEVKESIDENIYEKIPSIINSIAITDLETTKLLLDKRFQTFSEDIDELQKMCPEDKQLISKLINHGRRINRNGMPDKLTGNQKLDIINLVKLQRSFIENNNEPIDFDKYCISQTKGNFIIDLDKLHTDVLTKILVDYGMSEDEVSKLNPENLNWDMNNIVQLGKTSYTEEELGHVIKEASKGNFKNYINDTSNKYGKANKITENKFKDSKLNFKVWDKGIPALEFPMSGKWYSIKNWNRIPQESLCDGTYTDCCTAPNRINGNSMADYMLNKAINIVEVKDDKNKIMGMSRCFIGEVKGKQSIIIENMEINNNLLKTIEINNNSQEYANNILTYFKNWADAIGGENMPIYLSRRYSKLDENVFGNYKKTSAPISLTGKIAKPEIYMNTYGQYINPETISSRETNLYIIRE